MSLINSLLTAIRYFNSLDPYHRDVDNRPLGDLGGNQDIIADGLDTGILSQKIVSMATGFVARGLLGQNMGVGKTEISGWNFRIRRLLAVVGADASGTDPRQVPEVSLWSEQLAPSGNAEGMFTMAQASTSYNLYSIRVTVGQALTATTPFYDGSLNTYFPNVCEVQQASFALAAGSSPTPPSAGTWAALGAVGSNQVEILRILVPPATLGVLTGLSDSMITSVAYREEGFVTASSGSGGDFLTVDRANVYGLSNSSDANSDNLVLVNPLPETDLNLLVNAAKYGVAAASVPLLTNSPITQHTAQIGTWGSGCLEVTPVDAYIVQTMTLTRNMPSLGASTYLAREIWAREKTSGTWSLWSLIATSRGGVVELSNPTTGVYIGVSSKETSHVEYSLPRPASGKARVLLIGAGSGGTGGASSDQGTGANKSQYAGLGGVSGSVLEVEIEFNRDVGVSDPLVFRVPRRSYGGAGSHFSALAPGHKGENGGDTVLQIGDHEITAVGGKASSWANSGPVVYPNDPNAWWFTSDDLTPVGGYYTYDGSGNDPTLHGFVPRVPFVKVAASHVGYTSGATADQKQRRPHRMVLLPGSVLDLWDTEGVRVTVLRYQATGKCLVPMAGRSPTPCRCIDGTRGNPVVATLPDFWDRSWFQAPVYLQTMLDESPTFPEIPDDQLSSIRDRAETSFGTPYARDAADALGLPHAPKGGLGNISYSASPTVRGAGGDGEGVDLHPYGWGEHAPDTAWGYGGGGGGSGTGSNTSSQHYYPDPWDAGLDDAGDPFTGNPGTTTQGGYPGGRGGPGFVRFQPL